MIPLTVVLIAVGALILNAIGTDKPLLRTPLEAGLTEQTSHFIYEGDWVEDPARLNDVMQQFYDETGVIPFLYIFPNGFTPPEYQLSKITEKFYKENFIDQAHFLTVFRDNCLGGYVVRFQVGADAKQVIDDDALKEFSSYLKENYFDFDIDETEIFANTYSETATQIMSEEIEAPGWHNVLIVFGSFVAACLSCCF